MMAMCSSDVEPFNHKYVLFVIASETIQTVCLVLYGMYF